MLTASAFFAAFCGGCLLALFRHPVYGLVTYIGLVYVHPPSAWWGSVLPDLRWSLIAAVITLFAAMIRKSEHNKPGLFQFGLIWGMLFFVIWTSLQLFWALDDVLQTDFIVIYAKFTLLIVLIYKCIDSLAHLKVFLWAHAAGCFYLGTVVIADYLGGRFEGFRGPGIDEANAAALLIVTGVISTFALFLAGKLWEKVAAVGFMPFTLNAMVATISRSGFLALMIAGIIFNVFAPKNIIGAVRIFSVSGLVLLVLITNPVYWERIGTVLLAGEEVAGVDTGSSRLVLIQEQFEMFSEYPMGCGHRCTAILSPAYLDDRYLTGREGQRARSSHNTFMSLLVEQGLPGAALYLALLLWVSRHVLRLRGVMRDSNGLVPIVYTATVSILGAITVGDLFVDYLKFEARFWFIGILMVLIKLNANRDSAVSLSAESPVRRSEKAHRRRLLINRKCD